MSKATTMIGGGASQEEAEAVRLVMQRAGFEGPCEAVLGSQGEGISVIVIETTISTFLSAFLAPFAADAQKRLKKFFKDQHDARNDTSAHLRQTYIRPDIVSSEEWEQNKPQGRMVGWTREGSDQPELTLDSLMPDEAWDALLELDVESLESGTYSWNSHQRAWCRSDHH